MARITSRHTAVLAAALLAAGAAHANDSAAELSIGGLTFVQNNDIAMESEDLRIALDSISVRYEFKNTSSKPVNLTVAFPLPDIDLSEADNIALPAANGTNFVDFQTSIDGTPVQFDMQQRAKIGDRDVSAVLNRLNIPLLPVGNREIRVDALSETTRKTLLDEGLLMPAGTNDRGRPQYRPGWVVQTSVVRQQSFPADKTVIVEHRYRPSVGTSFDTILRSGLRQSKGLSSEIARYRRDYCIGDAFLAQLDKLAGNTSTGSAKLAERRINYILKTGANWAGSIKSFKLTIDPGASDRLVSFCGGKLVPNKTGALEFTAVNFKPDQDLRILILGKF